MKKGYLLTLMAMVVAIGCNAQDEMIDRRTVTDFDLKRYMGRWYELARYDHRFERNMVQCEAFYTLHPDGKVEVRNTGLDTTTGKPHTSIGKAKAGKHTGQLRVSFFLFFYSDYNILALGPDYDWALVGSHSPKYLWILSRTPSLPQTTLDHILNIARHRGYDTTQLIWVEQ